MKTAMQNLKTHIQNMVENGGDMDLLCVIGLIDSTFVIEEKQQIEDAYEKGTDKGINDGGEDSENYYNSTFSDSNQAGI